MVFNNVICKSNSCHKVSEGVLLIGNHFTPFLTGWSCGGPDTVQPDLLCASFSEDSPSLALPHLTAGPASKKVLPPRTGASAALPFLVFRCRPAHRGAERARGSQTGWTHLPSGWRSCTGFQKTTQDRTSPIWNSQDLSTDTKNTAIKEEIHKSDLIRIKTFAA